MIVAMDYTKIKNADYVFTGANNYICAMIRIFSSGIKNIFNKLIPTHEGIAIWSKIGDANCLHIAEMLPGDDGQPGDLKIHPMSKYLQDGYFSPYIISIKRAQYYEDNSDKRARLISTVSQLWQYGKTKYDYSGAANFVLPFLKDSPSRLYCSQLRQILDKDNGFNACPDKNLKVTPYDHFKSNQLRTILGT